MGPMVLGIFHQLDDPKFMKALDSIVSRFRAHEVFPGLLAPMGSIESSLRLGFKLISLGGYLDILKDGVLKTLETARTRLTRKSDFDYNSTETMLRFSLGSSEKSHDASSVSLRA